MIESRILPHNPKAFQLAVLPKPVDIFSRDQNIPQADSFFGVNIDNIAVIPVRAELSKNHLADYLTMMNGQKILDQGKKLGLVFLVNDHAGDRGNKRLLAENSKTVNFLASLGRKVPPGEDVDIPQSYRKVATEIIEKDALEVRVDYIHSSQDFPDFGALRLHLLRLAQALKSSLIPESKAVLHFHDVDAKLSKAHFGDIMRAYEADPRLLFNISEFDLIPGTHEDVKAGERDISREMLLTFDNYRLYQYGKLAKHALSGHTFSDITTQSGRFSFLFKNGQVNHQLARTLAGTASYDDYLMSDFAARDLAHIPGAMRYNGEIAFLHRARTSSALASVAQLGPDGEEVFAVVSQNAFIREGFKRTYDLNTEAREFIRDLEEHIAKIDNKAAVQQGQVSYSEILKAEILTEREKVERRVDKLLAFVRSVAQDTQVAPEVERTIAHYVKCFPDDVAFIKKNALIRPEKDIITSFMTKYDSFFNPNAMIHTQIATLRALRKYAFMRGLSVTEVRNSHAFTR